ncbi:MAG: helix-turn-helix domain containing protein [Candidatus Binatia bacterium]|nr:helix-turn-helix domain containing protein [Candidatus Binatia bacterium]
MPRATNEKAPRRRKRSTPLTRSKIAEVTLDLMREGGVEAVSMRQIADRLGVDVAAPYRHFGNKEDIVQAAGDLAARAVDLRAPASGDWETRFAELCTTIRSRLRRHPELSLFGGGSAGSSPFNAKAFGLIAGVLFEAGLRGNEIQFAAQHTLDTLTAIAHDEILRLKNSSEDNHRFHETFMEHLPDEVRADLPPQRGRSTARLFDEYFQYAVDALLRGLVGQLNPKDAPPKRRASLRKTR